MAEQLLAKRHGDPECHPRKSTLDPIPVAADPCCNRAQPGAAMRRRNFITLCGCAAATAGWPLWASSQPAARPLVGYISRRFPEAHYLVVAFEDGLREGGFTVLRFGRS